MRVGSAIEFCLFELACGPGLGISGGVGGSGGAGRGEGSLISTFDCLRFY